jgi:hypothetical protein
VSNLITLFRENSNSCISGIIFLVVIYNLWVRVLRGCGYNHEKVKFIKMYFVWKNCYILCLGGFVGSSFVERSSLSYYDLIFLCWTMMFLRMILHFLILVLKQAQDCWNWSWNDQIMVVFVFVFLQFMGVSSIRWKHTGVSSLGGKSPDRISDLNILSGSKWCNVLYSI